MPASESSAQAQAREQGITAALARLLVLRPKIARLEGEIARPEGRLAAQGASRRPVQAGMTAREAARLERQWQETIAAGRAELPSGRPAGRLGLSYSEAAAEVERQVAEAGQEATDAWWRWGNLWDRADPGAASAYVTHHREQARARAWAMIFHDLGMGDRPAVVNKELSGPALAAARLQATPEQAQNARRRQTGQQQRESTQAQAARIAHMLITGHPAAQPGGAIGAEIKLAEVELNRDDGDQLFTHNVLAVGKHFEVTAERISPEAPGHPGDRHEPGLRGSWR